MLSKMVHDDGPDGPHVAQRGRVQRDMLLLVAGHDSTVNTISHCVLTVLRNPGSLELLRRRPELIPGAIEEVLRLESAVQFFPSRIRSRRHRDRWDGHPEGFGGLPDVRRGEPRPAAVPQPEQFDPERKDNEHFGWGSGIHTCFGGPLARLEVNSRWKPSCAAWRTRGSSWTRRRTGKAMSFAARDTCGSTSIESETKGTNR